MTTITPDKDLEAFLGEIPDAFGDKYQNCSTDYVNMPLASNADTFGHPELTEKYDGYAIWVPVADWSGMRVAFGQMFESAVELKSGLVLHEHLVQSAGLEYTVFRPEEVVYLLM